MREGGRRRLLEELEPALATLDEADALPPLAFLVADEVALDREELHAGQRRALLLLAAGGDPTRALQLAARAVTALAADLDDVERRSRLAAALAALRADSDALPAVTAALDTMLGQPDLAWRALACALVADALVAE